MVEGGNAGAGPTGGCGGGGSAAGHKQQGTTAWARAGRWLDEEEL